MRYNTHGRHSQHRTIFMRIHITFTVTLHAHVQVNQQASKQASTCTGWYAMEKHWYSMYILGCVLSAFDSSLVCQLRLNRCVEHHVSNEIRTHRFVFSSTQNIQYVCVCLLFFASCVSSFLFLHNHSRCAMLFFIVIISLLIFMLFFLFYHYCIPYTYEFYYCWSRLLVVILKLVQKKK